MADFNIAYTSLLADEGGYANDPHDSGGETYHGISRNNFPSWEGWGIIDPLKVNAGFPKVLDSIAQLQDAVKLFYLNNFWRFAALPSQSLANKLLSESVNLGLKTATKILQLSLQGLGIAINGGVDGEWGHATEAAAQVAPQDKLEAEFRAQLVFHYLDIIRENEAESIFEKGWIRRAVK